MFWLNLVTVSQPSPVNVSHVQNNPKQMHCSYILPSSVGSALDCQCVQAVSSLCVHLTDRNKYEVLLFTESV